MAFILSVNEVLACSRAYFFLVLLRRCGGVGSLSTIGLVVPRYDAAIVWCSAAQRFAFLLCSPGSLFAPVEYDAPRKRTVLVIRTGCISVLWRYIVLSWKGWGDLVRGGVYSKGVGAFVFAVSTAPFLSLSLLAPRAVRQFFARASAVAV